jgi:hypothetical protein
MSVWNEGPSGSKAQNFSAVTSATKANCPLMILYFHRSSGQSTRSRLDSVYFIDIELFGPRHPTASGFCNTVSVRHKLHKLPTLTVAPRRAAALRPYRRTH